MDYKVVVSDPKTGKSYQVELSGEDAKKLRGKKIGDSFEGSILGVSGYTLEVSGGSNKGGFPMKKGLHTQKSQYVLAEAGIGYKPKNKVRRRRLMSGEVISDDTVQVNTFVKEFGRKSLEDIFSKPDSSSESSEDDDGKEKKE